MHAENEEVFVRSALQPSVSVNTNLGFIYLDRTRRTSSCASSSVKKRLQRDKLQETRFHMLIIYFNFRIRFSINVFPYTMQRSRLARPPLGNLASARDHYLPRAELHCGETNTEIAHSP